MKRCSGCHKLISIWGSPDVVPIYCDACHETLIFENKSRIDTIEEEIHK